jgi:hypothetical protein
MRNATHNKFSTNGGNAVAAMDDAFEHSQASDGTGSRKRTQERLRDEQAWARMDDDGSPVAGVARRHAGSEIDLSTSRHTAAK